MNLNFYRRSKTVDTQVSTVAFYNLENFFDTKDDPHALDDDFTPDGKKAWTPKRFRHKVKKLSKTIRRIGDDVSMQPPVLLGLAEVENRGVIERLVETKFLNQVNYGIAHFDSPDERGIDTALLYNRDVFQLLHQERIPLYLTEEDGDRDYTRDILYVNGMWGEDLFTCLSTTGRPEERGLRKPKKSDCTPPKPFCTTSILWSRKRATLISS